MDNGKGDIALIVLDTLRWDFSEPIWRVLKPLGFVRYKAIAPSFWTLPSHVSMFTGLYPSAHGVHVTEKRKYLELRFRGESIINELKREGFRINWLTANAWVSPAFDFPEPDFLFIPRAAHGKRLLPLTEEEDRFKLNELVGLTYGRRVLKLIKKRRFKLLFKLAVNHIYNKISSKMSAGWPLDKGGKEISQKLMKIDGERNFTFINLMEVHEPYVGFSEKGLKNPTGLPPSIDFRVERGVREKAERKLKFEYRREVEYLSELLPKILEKLRDSLVIITSDHGQVLGEREVLYHTWGLYDELLVVPLFVRYPVHVRKRGKGVVSLTKIPELIWRYIEGELKSDGFLFGRAFAELFGPYIKYVPKTKEAEEWLERLNQRRVAVFEGGSKLVYNSVTGEVEEFYGDKKMKEELLESARAFLEG